MPRLCLSLLLHSRKLTWKPKKGPTKTTVPLKGDPMGFHVSLGECSFTLRIAILLLLLLLLIFVLLLLLLLLLLLFSRLLLVILLLVLLYSDSSH